MSEPQRVLIESFIVVRCQTGDDSAFESLYELYGDRLLYYLRRLMGGGGSAEDTAQSVWLTVYRKIKTLDEPLAFRGWLYRIAHNEAISALRRTGREISWEEAGANGAGALDDRPDNVDEFDGADAAAVHAGLDRLSAPHREVLTLRFLHEMTYEEIAEVAQVGLGTVRSRLHHAKRSLRHQLEDMTSTSLKGARR